MEYAEILERKISREAADNVTQALIDSPFVQMVTPAYQWYLIQEDPDDNKFVDVAIAAAATYIVTNDGHFGVLDKTEFPKVDHLRIDELTPNLLS